MVASAPHTEPSGFFALRTPLLPWETLVHFGAGLAAPRAHDDDLEAALETDRAQLTERVSALVSDELIREALCVASPSLDEAIDAWLADPADKRARGVLDNHTPAWDVFDSPPPR